MNIKKQAIESGKAIDMLQKKLEHEQGKEEFVKNYHEAELNRKLMQSLSQTRKEQNITQSQLAKALRTTQKQISKYETLEQSPSITKLMALCNEIDIEIILRKRDSDKIIFHT
ncbi:helix-turn-helix transcriptional regulator [Acidaminobacter sp. JC074]|uniref:helix-turn-helix domain-containing protein n=1 Tax=Acidaminobacter sp. JC074 TaxID=2530199 RepID=UPI001F0F5FF5|nr:helix-turn-helix transcriptional regulator [Acidaminobacter sp. JC074]MCH4886332.1 helix-turn-helix transcriptional regulator [Acidaminobacter sp. JC074]